MAAIVATLCAAAARASGSDEVGTTDFATTQSDASGTELQEVVYSNWVYRAQPVPYEWTPAGMPHSEKAVIELDPATFRVPVGW